MSIPRSATKWPELLDSSLERKKHIYPPKSKNPAISSNNPASELEDWPLNSDWQLARDTSRRSTDPKKKSIPLPKGIERKIWSKPALVELTKTAVRTERAMESAKKYQEMLQAKKIQPKKTVLPTKPQKPKRAPLWQPKIRVQRKSSGGVKHRSSVRRHSTQKRITKAGQAPALKLQKSSSPKATEKKTPMSRVSQGIQQWHNGRPRNIRVVDAKTEPWTNRHTSGGAEQPLPLEPKTGETPRLRKAGILKKSYGVPLCNRPTKIMGLGFPYSRHMQMRQEQLGHQPEYRDQYKRMLRQQQRQYEMRQMYRSYGQSGGKMAQLPYSIQAHRSQQVQQKVLSNPPYAVPPKSQVKSLEKGKRLCGNFYYY